MLISRAAVAAGRFLRRLRRAEPSAPAPPAVSPARRHFLQAASVGVTGYAFAGASIGLAGRSSVEIDHSTIVIPGLPEKLRGTTITLLSDIHSGMYMSKADMQGYCKLANDLKSDLIVVPGDFVNSQTEEVYPFAEAFAELRAPYGVWGCTGNHDYLADVDTVVREAEQAGIRMLANTNAAVDIRGEKLWLLGVDDLAIGRGETHRFIETGKSAPIESMLRGVPEDAVKILLAHRPYPFEDYAELGMHLTLSGHTHGGQVVLANVGDVNVSLARIASKFIAGHYVSTRVPGAQLYVSRGIGCVGLPIRFNCPPEITQITLA